ncbi:MAG: RNA polymerase subunit sigma-70 [Planctomycetota bacterium]|nr:MAG: RNA polymerase subunit sigma-70 [Planctomycetota bacterium]
MSSSPDENTPPPGEVTQFLAALPEGSDARASAQVVNTVYAELRRLADFALRHERADHTLQPTALVHEAWMKLASQEGVAWKNRSHFLGVASLAMRRILVDHARGRARDKRGGGAVRETLHTEFPSDFNVGNELDVLALDEGLEKLKIHSERAAKVVELRFFAGLTEDETATVLGVTRPTVTRDWHAARAWLLHWMTTGNDA